MRSVTTIVGERRLSWEIEGDGVKLDGDDLAVELVELNATEMSVIVGGSSYYVSVHPGKKDYIVCVNHKRFHVLIEDPADKYLQAILGKEQAAHARLEVRAPMPGLVAKCEVAVGAEVHAGSGLIILEAMKMENEIRSTRDGVVTRVHVKERQTVEKGELLITVE